MKKSRNLLTNKKGISPLLIGIFITLLLFVLMSTLFFGLSISNSSLTNYLRIEQDRMQEKILIAGPNALKIDRDGMVLSLLVNNTGALAARIRALYIAEKFIFDPSTLPGDSYIAPQTSKWIDLSSINPRIPIDTTTLSVNWTVTTQRGTKSSDTGADLWLGPPIDSSDPNRIYFGPLLLFYNYFHWSNNGGATWHSGWSIPQNTQNIIWRILIANIDDRQIVLSTTSSFAMVQNSQQPNKIATWDIGPTNLNPSYLDPGHYYFLHFSLNGPNSLSYMYSPNPISSNFLTFIGNFVEADNSVTPFGQTIPFEAILVTG